MRLPENVRSTLAEMQESGAAKTYLRLNQVMIGDRDAFVGDCDSAAKTYLWLNQIKDAPLSLKLVAEEEKRAKREADKVVNETIWPEWPRID